MRCDVTRLREIAYPIEVKVLGPRRVVAAILSPMIGVIDHEDEDGNTIVRIGGDALWIARYLAGFECPYEVLDAHEVRAELRALGRRLMRDNPGAAGRVLP